jgi:uncharacterized protein YjiS (DUF1127 family)
MTTEAVTDLWAYATIAALAVAIVFLAGRLSAWSLKSNGRVDIRMEANAKNDRMYANCPPPALRGSTLMGPARNWLARRQLARLTHLDDRLLLDIGFTRAELNYTLASPLSVNTVQRLQRTMRYRSVWGRAVRHGRT